MELCTCSASVHIRKHNVSTFLKWQLCTFPIFVINFRLHLISGISFCSLTISIFQQCCATVDSTWLTFSFFLHLHKGKQLYCYTENAPCCILSSTETPVEEFLLKFSGQEDITVSLYGSSGVQGTYMQGSNLFVLSY